MMAHILKHCSSIWSVNHLCRRKMNLQNWVNIYNCTAVPAHSTKFNRSCNLICVCVIRSILQSLLYTVFQKSDRKIEIWKSRLSSSYTITSVAVCAQSGRRLHGHMRVVEHATVELLGRSSGRSNATPRWDDVSSGWRHESCYGRRVAGARSTPQSTGFSSHSNGEIKYGVLLDKNSTVSPAPWAGALSCAGRRTGDSI